MKLYLIRHGKTYGNTLGRYIGTTDESLCEEGVFRLEGKIYPSVETVYASPLKRCTETAGIIYPKIPIKIIDELAECDFGDFENKNFKELDGNPDYQKWIDSNGTLPFPNGESQQEFRTRCIKGFRLLVDDMLEKHVKKAAVVAHGGTIMSILDYFSIPHEDFYHWQVKNSSGFEIEIDETNWKKGNREVTVCGPVSIISADRKSMK